MGERGRRKGDGEEDHDQQEELFVELKKRLSTSI